MRPDQSGFHHPFQPVSGLPLDVLIYERNSFGGGRHHDVTSDNDTAVWATPGLRA